MDEPFRNLLDEIQGLATENERPHVEDERPSVNEGTRPTEAVREAKPVERPAMPLPRNVRGRRY